MYYDERKKNRPSPVSNETTYSWGKNGKILVESLTCFCVVVGGNLKRKFPI